MVLLHKIEIYWELNGFNVLNYSRKTLHCVNIPQKHKHAMQFAHWVSSLSLVLIIPNDGKRKKNEIVVDLAQMKIKCWTAREAEHS